MEKEHVAQQHLEVIYSMINQAKGNFKGNKFYFLLWGWVIAQCNLFCFGALLLEVSFNPHWVWLATIPTAIVAVAYGYSRSKTGTRTTYIDETIKWTWISYGVVIFSIVFMGQKIGYQINPIIMLVSVIPTWVSGILLRFKPLQWGGVIFWIGGMLSFFAPLDIQYLLAAITITFGYIVPGFMIKKEE